MPVGLTAIICGNKIHAFCKHDDLVEGTLRQTGNAMSSVVGTQTNNYFCVFCNTEYAQLTDQALPGSKNTVCADGVHDDAPPENIYIKTKEEFDHYEAIRKSYKIPIKNLGNKEEFERLYLMYNPGDEGRIKLAKFKSDEQAEEERKNREKQELIRAISNSKPSGPSLEERMRIQRENRKRERKRELSKSQSSNKITRGFGKIKKQRTRTKPKSKNKSRMGRSPHKPKKQRTRTKHKPKKQRTRTKPKLKKQSRMGRSPHKPKK